MHQSYFSVGIWRSSCFSALSLWGASGRLTSPAGGAESKQLQLDVPPLFKPGSYGARPALSISGSASVGMQSHMGRSGNFLFSVSTVTKIGSYNPLFWTRPCVVGEAIYQMEFVLCGDFTYSSRWEVRIPCSSSENAQGLSYSIKRLKWIALSFLSVYTDVLFL